jgi:hypothetical protein
LLNSFQRLADVVRNKVSRTTTTDGRVREAGTDQAVRLLRGWVEGQCVVIVLEENYRAAGHFSTELPLLSGIPELLLVTLLLVIKGWPHLVH